MVNIQILECKTLYVSMYSVSKANLDSHILWESKLAIAMLYEAEAA